MLRIHNLSCFQRCLEKPWWLVFGPWCFHRRTAFYWCPPVWGLIPGPKVAGLAFGLRPVVHSAWGLLWHTGLVPGRANPAATLCLACAPGPLETFPPGKERARRTCGANALVPAKMPGGASSLMYIGRVPKRSPNRPIGKCGLTPGPDPKFTPNVGTRNPEIRRDRTPRGWLFALCGAFPKKPPWLRLMGKFPAVAKAVFSDDHPEEHYQPWARAFRKLPRSAHGPTL